MTASNALPDEAELSDAISALREFCGHDLTQTIYRIESALRNVNVDKYAEAMAAPKPANSTTNGFNSKTGYG